MISYFLHFASSIKNFYFLPDKDNQRPTTVHISELIYVYSVTLAGFFQGGENRMNDFLRLVLVMRPM